MRNRLRTIRLASNVRYRTAGTSDRTAQLGPTFGRTALASVVARIRLGRLAMARQCHLNTCPTGIAERAPRPPAKFRGTPEQVIAYFTFIAEERAVSWRRSACAGWTI